MFDLQFGCAEKMASTTMLQGTQSTQTEEFELEKAIYVRKQFKEIVAANTSLLPDLIHLCLEVYISLLLRCLLSSY